MDQFVGQDHVALIRAPFRGHLREQDHRSPPPTRHRSGHVRARQEPHFSPDPRPPLEHRGLSEPIRILKRAGGSYQGTQAKRLARERSQGAGAAQHPCDEEDAEGVPEERRRLADGSGYRTRARDIEVLRPRDGNCFRRGECSRFDDGRGFSRGHRRLGFGRGQDLYVPGRGEEAQEGQHKDDGERRGPQQMKGPRRPAPREPPERERQQQQQRDLPCQRGYSRRGTDQ